MVEWLSFKVSIHQLHTVIEFLSSEVSIHQLYIVIEWLSFKSSILSSEVNIHQLHTVVEWLSFKSYSPVTHCDWVTVLWNKPYCPLKSVFTSYTLWLSDCPLKSAFTSYTLWLSDCPLKSVFTSYTVADWLWFEVSFHQLHTVIERLSFEVKHISPLSQYSPVTHCVWVTVLWSQYFHQLHTAVEWLSSEIIIQLHTDCE